MTPEGGSREGDVSVMAVRESALRQAGEAVDSCVDAAFSLVESVRAEVCELLCHPGPHRRATDLAGLEPRLRALLVGADHPRLAGLGYIAALGALDDEPRCLRWVRRGEDGSLPVLRPDLDPDSLGFYDYTAADWFQRPLTTRQRSIVGPYVDFAGTDEYVVTLTVPVECDGDDLGVAGADLRLGDLADAVMPALCSIGADAALVNAAGRVVVSSSPRWQVGALVRQPQVTARQPCTGTPWTILA